MAHEIIVAVYETADQAEQAVRDMEAAGVPSSAITRHAEQGQSTTTTSEIAAPREEPGFWARLFGEEHAYQAETSMYDRRVELGSTVVSVRVPEEHTTHVSDILERHHPIDLDEHSDSSVSATNDLSGVSSAAGSDVGVPGSGISRAPRADTDTGDTLSSSVVPAAMSSRTGTGTEETIALSEEQIAVGKRAVDRGTTRVRRYVVETPVEEAVSLRDETVSIERRPVSGDRTVGDSAFTEKTIEVSETTEEAVIAKTARVREEVVINKEATERTETVRDTVRREDVEITKDAGTTGTGAAVRPVSDPAGRS